MRATLRPRLLPVVAVAATVLLGFKVAGLIMGDPTDLATKALAQTPSAASAPASAAPADLKKAATTNGFQPGTAAAPVKTAARAAKSVPEQRSIREILAKDPQALTPSEIEVLQQLAQRRAELDQRASDLDRREVVLQATEKNIDEKIVKLQDLQKRIEADVQKQNAQDKVRIERLVKIYEAMRPSDAAKIFDQLNMPVLLQVLQNMRERITAPILAAMDPEKAKAVTIALAEKHSQDFQEAASTTAPAGTPGQSP